MITSVEDLPPPVFDLPSPTGDLLPPPTGDLPSPSGDLPSPTDELLPPPTIPSSEEDTNKDNNDVVDNGETPKDENNTEEASKDGKSSYVALVSPTGFVPAAFGDSTNDNDKNIAPTNRYID